MAKILKNEFSWSVSRAQLFQSCQRAYYFSYYGSWNGWDRNAPERVRQLYILKNVKTMPLWAGAVVHDLIKDALERFVRTGVLPAAAELQGLARERLRAGWVEATGRQWLDQPKKTNLFELYYGNGKTLPKELTDSIRERVYTALEAFATSAAVRHFLQVPVSGWKPIDTLDTFFINEHKVWCAIDFAFTDAEGVLHIVDWKTGGENKASLRQQLGCYALFALEKWGGTLEKMALHGIFLNDGGRRSDYSLDAELLVSVKDQILLSVQAMRARLRDKEENVAEEDDFPQCGNAEVCSHCPFREVCFPDLPLLTWAPDSPNKEE